MKKLIRFLILAVIVIVLIQYIPYTIEYFFPRNYNRYVEKYAAEYDVDKNLVYAVIKAESNFNREARSNKGAKGLMQLTDETAVWCAKKIDMDIYDILDPDDNIRLGTYYLSYLIEKCGGNEQNAIAAYNAGHGNVEKWLKNSEYSSDGKTLSKIPFAETEKYVKKVELFKKIYIWENEKKR
ncbi:MAG: lytic transglycosylase domain-containing protein [Clostridia bacterium]|nr:lytic transglycosylase domain-containing protein [Clostridia bacterium]